MIYINPKNKEIVKMKEIDLDYPTCPIRNILSRFSDKWSLLILSSIYRSKNIRYGEIKKEIPDISEKMLSKSLKNLEDYKLITRKVYAEIPPRVEYSMTETGNKLIPSLQMMIDWASEHFKDITQ